MTSLRRIFTARGSPISSIFVTSPYCDECFIFTPPPPKKMSRFASELPSRAEIGLVMLNEQRFQFSGQFPVALPSISAAGGGVNIPLKSGHFVCLCLFVFQVNIEEAREARARNAHAQKCDLTAPTHARTHAHAVCLSGVKTVCRK